MKVEAVITLLFVALSSTAVAQQSEGYRLSEYVFCAGGGPRTEGEPGSTGYRISSSMIGQQFGADEVRGSLQVHYPGYQTSWAPPVEVFGLRFDAPASLHWDAAPLADHYHVYRDPLEVLGSGTCGSCQQHTVYGMTTTDVAEPSSGSGFLYLICASNRLGEEGTRGSDSDGVARPPSDPCP